MATAHITIPFPVLPLGGHFGVVIKNTATGVIVYTGSQTNAAFDLVLPGGSYEMFTTYLDYTNAWCFEVSSCTCIPYISSVITESAPGVRYLEITFDISGWTFCPFLIEYFPVRAASATGIVITSLLDLTFVSGTTYKFKSFIGSASSVGFTVHNGIYSSSPICVNTTISYSCSPALLADPHHPFALYVKFVRIGSNWVMRFHFWSCGASCHTFTLHYWQNYVVTGYVPDEAVITLTVDCGAGPDFTLDVPLSPVHTFWQSQATLDPSDPAFLYLSYLVRLKDCCGVELTSLTAVEHGPIFDIPA